MIQQADDFRAEAAELRRLLNGLSDSDWTRATQFKAWTIDDIIRHLHMGDRMALASASDPAEFTALMADIQAERKKGLSRPGGLRPFGHRAAGGVTAAPEFTSQMADTQGERNKGLSHIDETGQRVKGLGGRPLLQRWHETAEQLCTALAEKPADTRLKWAGPDMGVRMFTTARQMEAWSHAQAIYDLLGIERPAASPRLRNIAEIGVRTFGWAYRNRGLPVPPVTPSVRLDTPFGETWEWKASDSDSVEGSAIAFCQVVTQTRNVADTPLSIHGETARDWMRIVQCFAGPPETPPAPGTRYRSPR